MIKILNKISNIIFYKRKTVLLLWITLLIFSIITIAFNKNDNVETELNGVENSEAYKVKELLQENFSMKLGNSAAIAIESQSNTKNMLDGLKKEFPQISRIINVPSRTKHKTQLIYVEFNSEYKVVDMQKLTPKIREYLKVWSDKTKIPVYFTGSTPFQYDSKKSGKNDSLKGEIFALILSMFILVFSFGALLSAFLPLIIGATTIIFLNAIMKLLIIPVNPVSQILTGLVGLASAIDYSLFIVNRFKEELKDNNEKEAIKTAILYPGKTVIYSGLIMLVSISVLLLPDVSITRTVVINICIAVLISIFNSVFILPALLLTGQKYLDKPVFLSEFIRKLDRYLFWKNFSGHIANYNKTYFLVSLLILFGLSLPVTTIKLWSPVINIAPKDSESMIGYDVLKNDGWGGELVPVNIIIKTTENGVYKKEFISQVYNFTKALEKHPKVSSVQSLTSWDPNFNENDYLSFYSSAYNLKLLGINQTDNPLINEKSGNSMTLINVYPKDLIDLDDSFEIINFAREYSKDNPNILVGGIVARVDDFTKELYNYIPEMLLIIFLGIYFLLIFHMKSLILPLKAAIMNFLPILSAFGILTLVFQYGYFHNILDTPFNKAVTNIVPIVLFCVVFGLSMDYEILILSNISEYYEKTKDVKQSIIEGMAKSSQIITGAALILVAVFVPGIFSSSPQIQEICIGISSAVIIDATIVRLLLVPSFMMLMGKWNWWNPFRK